MKPVALQLIDSFHQGGSERQAVQLTRLLHESGRFRVQVACLNPGGVLRSEVENLGLGEVPAFPLNSFYDRNAFVQLRRFVRHLRASQIDILHTHDFYTNIFGTSAAALARVPVRIASRRETLGMRTPGQKRAERFAYSLSHQIVANSQAVCQQLIDEGVRASKIAVVYNGLDLDRVAPEMAMPRETVLAALNLPPEAGTYRRFVTIVANMRHDVKDYPMFLRAAQRVHEMVPDAGFLLAGEGELMQSIRGVAVALGIASETFLLGRCENVAQLLSISDVCVLSSRAEGFSNSILEYMAAARPVVATDVGGAREAVIEAETGHLVQSGDDATMAERIISLLGNPEQARAMGQKGRCVVEQKFSCAAQLKHTEELYDRLLEEQRVLSPVKVENATRESA